MESNNKFKIIEKAVIGRCAVASRDISPGELIMEDMTVIYGPKALVENLNLCVECLSQTKDKCQRCLLPKCCRLNYIHSLYECEIIQRYCKTQSKRQTWKF